MLSKTTKNPSTVIFKCINVVDKQRFDITVIKLGSTRLKRDFVQLEHRYLVSGSFYDVSDSVLVQVSKGGLFDLSTAMRKNKLMFNELTIRSLLHNMLSVLLYCQNNVSKPFNITAFDILVFKEANSVNPNDWIFKLKNCFIENQLNNFKPNHAILTKAVSPNTSFFTDEYIISAIVKLGSIVLDAIKNIYGYNSPLEFIHSKTYSASLRYVINCMIHYRAMKSPPSISELLLFFQTSQELYMEKLRSSLFEGVKVKRRLIDGIEHCESKSRSCFF